MWLGLCLLGAGLTLAATVVMNATIDMHRGQGVDIGVVAEVDGEYPAGTWSLPGWYGAVKGLVVDDGKVKTIESHLKTMSGWRWNLVVCLCCRLSWGCGLG